ncbi:MAG: hypothetical protein O2931_11940 [Planctomycetota bacterium]|nr:hypothetical protein [Planctomycetota bacterium]MDA1179498.1 hypothetical protein [Planctomycetota bacterium]
MANTPWTLRFLLTWLLAVPLASAAEFSQSDWTVETDVAVGDQPAVKHLAVFRRPHVYSFDPALSNEITVVDLVARRLELLDPKRQLCTSVDGSQVFTAMLQIDDRASRVNGARACDVNDLLRSFASPSFMVEFHREGLELNLNSNLLAYRLTCTQIDPEHLNDYLDFADWSARLNALHPGGLPAAARIQVNRELRMKQLAPQEVTRTIRRQGKASVARSSHRFRDVVSDEEREKVAEIDRLRENYTRVELSQYFQSTDEVVGPPRREKE